MREGSESGIYFRVYLSLTVPSCLRGMVAQLGPLELVWGVTPGQARLL